MQEQPKKQKRSKSFKPFLYKEEVKESFYLCIIDYIKNGLNPSQICKKLGISKQRLNWHLKSLKKKNIIEKIGYGVWKIKDKKRSKSLNHLPPNANAYKGEKEVRGHAFKFSLKIPKIRNWNNREFFLEKKGIKYKKIYQGYSFLFKNFRIWLCKKTIVFFQRKGCDFIDYNSKLAKESILNLFLTEIRALEIFLKLSLKINKKYYFKLSRQHFGLIQNELAKIYDKQKKKLNVRDYKGVWLTIDNSLNLNELETIHKDSADTDNIIIQRFFNQLKQNPEYNPQFVLNVLGNFGNDLNTFMKGFSDYGVAIKEHIGAIKVLGLQVGKLSDIITKLYKKTSK